MREFTMLRTEGKDVNWSLRCDAVAAKSTGEDNSLLIVSGIGPSTTIKAIAAMLHGNTRFVLKCAAFGAMQIDRSRFGYKAHRKFLGYGLVHTVIIAKDPSLLTNVSEDSLWHRLRSTDFTTPILREWMPWLIQELRSRGKLESPRAFGCKPGLLGVDTAGLDEIVSAGLKTGAINIK